MLLGLYCFGENAQYSDNPEKKVSLHLSMRLDLPISYLGRTVFSRWIYRTNVNKNPTDATVCRYLFTAKLFGGYEILLVD